MTAGGRRVMALVRDITITEALLTLFLAYNFKLIIETSLTSSSYGFHILGYRVHASLFSVMAGWIAEILFMLFFVYIAVQRTEHS